MNGPISIASVSNSGTLQNHEVTSHQLFYRTGNALLPPTNRSFWFQMTSRGKLSSADQYAFHGTYMLIYPNPVHENKVLRYSIGLLALFANFHVNCPSLLGGREINALGVHGADVRCHAT